MSDKDRRQVRGARAVTIANGVDLERFRPCRASPEPKRLLFIGSLAHLPNLLALEFFLKRVWPLLDGLEPTLHIIAGMRHDYFLDFYKDRAAVDLRHPRMEVEGFVADVRPAYERAAIVIAPLTASAGTNIKILEAMAMGKAVVSTPAGINGLDLDAGDVAVADSAVEMAQAIAGLIADPSRRRLLESHARATAERRFDWDSIARRQRELYQSLAG
jgi:glycosyltransferase involved in cell wall biosynthesis